LLPRYNAEELMKYLLIALACCLSSLCLSARDAERTDTLTAQALFLQMPGDALDLISTSTREDMVDYYRSGLAYAPKNLLGGECSLLELTPRYAKVQVTAASDVQLCVLPCGGGQVAAVVYTVDGGHSPDSSLRFYDAALRELPLKKFFKEPQLSDFMQPGAPLRELQSIVPFMLVSYSISEAGERTTLTATLNLAGMMIEEDYARLSPWLLPEPLTYTWNGRKFILPKK